MWISARSFQSLSMYYLAIRAHATELRTRSVNDGSWRRMTAVNRGRSITEAVIWSCATTIAAAPPTHKLNSGCRDGRQGARTGGRCPRCNQTHFRDLKGGWHDAESVALSDGALVSASGRSGRDGSGHVVRFAAGQRVEEGHRAVEILDIFVVGVREGKRGGDWTSLRRARMNSFMGWTSVAG